MSQSVEQALALIRENRPESTGRALVLLQKTVYSFSMAGDRVPVAGQVSGLG